MRITRTMPPDTTFGQTRFAAMARFAVCRLWAPLNS